jgi:hypothetical protein
MLHKLIFWLLLEVIFIAIASNGVLRGILSCSDDVEAKMHTPPLALAWFVRFLKYPL